MLIGHSVEVCKRCVLKVNADKSKMMAFGREGRSVCVESVDGR